MHLIANDNVPIESPCKEVQAVCVSVCEGKKKFPFLYIFCFASFILLLSFILHAAFMRNNEVERMEKERMLHAQLVKLLEKSQRELSNRIKAL